MKLFFTGSIYFLSLLPIYAGPGDAVINQLNQRIDELQYEIDGKDGVSDGSIQLPNEYTAERATKLYIRLTDSLQRVITDKEQEWMHTRDELKRVKNWLVDTSPDHFSEEFYLDKFETSYFLYADINLDLAKRRLKDHPAMALELYRDYREKEFANELVSHLVDHHTELFMSQVWRFGDDNAAIRTIIDELVASNPIKMKRWVGTNTAMGDLLNQSTNATTQLFTSLFYNFGRPSKSFYLLDAIENGEMTAVEAHALGENESKFRKKLIELSTKENILAQEAVQDRMQEEALKVIRPINDLHETKNPAVRFKSIEGMGADELYTYMTYAQEEIFTSTYNGFYERFIKQLDDKNGFSFLEEMNFNQYRTFIKMAAGYGSLESFLETMNEETQKKLLTKFVSNLEDGTVENSLQASVDVADTFGSINDKELKTFFERKMKDELQRVEGEYDSHGIRIYSLLNGILAQSSEFSDEWMAKLVRDYDIPKINELQYKDLLNSDGKLIEQVFFFDDDDGKASYYSFLPTFQNSNWDIKDNNTYLQILSKDKTIEIYANKPQFEFKGKDAIRDYFATTGKTPSVVIHRGHSFYVDTTIHSLTPQAKLVLLGSCGGYHNLTSVLDRSPEVHIISSKQIGAMGINDPMIRQLNDDFLKEEDVNWTSFWNELGNKLKGNSKNYSRFKDYVPPHKNLGAIFIMAYNRLKAKDEGRG